MIMTEKKEAKNIDLATPYFLKGEGNTLESD
jgi:hypothetical protein